jgi:hypothetical protein
VVSHPVKGYITLMKARERLAFFSVRIIDACKFGDSPLEIKKSRLVGAGSFKRFMG